MQLPLNKVCASALISRGEFWILIGVILVHTLCNLVCNRVCRRGCGRTRAAGPRIISCSCCWYERAKCSFLPHLSSVTIGLVFMLCAILCAGVVAAQAGGASQADTNSRSKPSAQSSRFVVPSTNLLDRRCVLRGEPSVHCATLCEHANTLHVPGATRAHALYTRASAVWCAQVDDGSAGAQR